MDAGTEQPDFPRGQWQGEFPVMESADDCPAGIPADPGHDYVGPFGGPYVCGDCGAPEQVTIRKILVTTTACEEDLEQVLGDLRDIPGTIVTVISVECADE